VRNILKHKKTHIELLIKMYAQAVLIPTDWMLVIGIGALLTKVVTNNLNAPKL
jgi:hypothetical protein